MNQILSLLGPSALLRFTGSIDVYLDFFRHTHDVFFAYVYHRTGSLQRAEEILSSVYIDLLSKTLSFWWFQSTDLSTLVRLAESHIHASSSLSVDIETVYVPSVPWGGEEEDRSSVSSLHEALWSLPAQEQALLTFTLLVGLSADDSADALRLSKQSILTRIEQARSHFLERWSPSQSVSLHLSDLAFLPSMHTSTVVSLEDALTLKAQQLHVRTMQWVMIGTVFAVLSNVIVASVLAFAVITQPPTSLHQTQRQLASLDRLLLEREQTLSRARESLSLQMTEAQRLDAQRAVRSLTHLGLSVSRDALLEQQQKEEKTKAVLQILDRAVAFVHQFVAAVRTLLPFL